VRLAQPVGEVLGLGARGVVGDDLDPVSGQVLSAGPRLGEGLLDLRRDAAGEGEPSGDPL
jgi:hypothetical protein